MKHFFHQLFAALKNKTIFSENLRKLRSQFHISYHIILNHIHNNNIQSIIDFIKKSMINQDIMEPNQLFVSIESSK